MVSPENGAARFGGRDHQVANQATINTWLRAESAVSGIESSPLGVRLFAEKIGEPGQALDFLGQFPGLRLQSCEYFRRLPELADAEPQIGPCGPPWRG